MVDGRTIIAEVKEITRNKDERASDRLLEERGYGEVLGRTAGRHPGLLVLYDEGRIARHLDPYHIMTAMYGLEVVSMAVPADPSISPYRTGAKLGPDKKMTNDANTISAVGALVVTAPDDVLALHVYHNAFAATPIEPALLVRRGIRQWQIDVENRKWVELR